MKIKSITIENFKAFSKVKLECNEQFNFIVGENSIGKTSIFESLLLWKVGYDVLIQKNNIEFYGRNTPRYLTIDSLFALRITSVKDLLNSNTRKKISICVELVHGEESFPLRIDFEKPETLNSYLRIKYSFESFRAFKTRVRALNLNLRNAIFLFQSRPIFHVIKNEPFYNNAQLYKKISLGKSHEIIRNKILRCESTETKFQTLESRLNEVFDLDISVRLKNRNKQDEEYVRIGIQEGEKRELDISLVGSGILQVIEIFSTLEFLEKQEHCMNVLLVDEPDSHIHSNLQCKLIDELKKDDGSQVFIISHNDRLIEKAEENELFFINKANVQSGLVKSLPVSSYDSVSTHLAGSLLNLTEAQQEKIIVITEGKTDKILLDTAWSKLHDEESPFLFISSGLNLDESRRTGNADFVRRTIELVSTITDDLRLVGLFDNDREGNEQFKGVNKVVFENYSIENDFRKHKAKNIYARLLSVPEFREGFVTNNDMLQRYFVIEHYFQNDVLQEHNMKGSGILGTEVFNIEGDKDAFAQASLDFDAARFENFQILFDSITELFEENQEE